MNLFRLCFAVAIASVIAAVCASAHAAPASTKSSKAADARCHVGAYRLDDGRVVSVMPSDDPSKLRWRLLDGRTGKLVRENGAWISTRGWTGQPDGIRVAFGTCNQSRIRFDGRRGRKIGFDIAETRFDSHGLSLRGRLVLPRGQDKVPVVVLVHGSEKVSGVDAYFQQNLFPSQGVGVFVYDKRGTGGSEGKFSKDFDLLSDDAVAALAEARRLGGARISRIGLHGSSQGGWVAPLAASKTPQAQFVMVVFGLADSVLSEDRDQVAADLRAAGFGDAETLAKARRVSDATGLLAASKGQRGWDELDVLRAQYQHEPWWQALKGEYTGDVVQRRRGDDLMQIAMLDSDVSWTYDPMPVLRKLTQPQMWILGGDDAEAPSQETQLRLSRLAAEGRPIEGAVFPQADHGILEFETDASGERLHTRMAEGYIPLQLDWIKHGKLDGRRYGRAVRLPVSH
ncbi:alpha/beta hydrolase fold family protein [Lysobacter antibioticus]|uniref:alpha/beta hydrolase family protein n=1 Tax=Lysobacter antibioticus TaxID=84531 RepID=UPI00071707F6|nr:alpha/beta hydrolase [Lysobacter antibioticus]ALN65578.1 alpha/beta hydrolase fold family protein [Lysobacter antibioticus]